MRFIIAGLAMALGCTSAAAQTQVLKEKTSEIPKVAEHEARIFSVDLPAGGAGSWHTHPSPVFIYVERGTLTTQGEGQEAKEIKAGQAFLDPANKKHHMQNKSAEPVRLIVFQIAAPSKPLHDRRSRGGATTPSTDPVCKGSGPGAPSIVGSDREGAERQASPTAAVIDS